MSVCGIFLEAQLKKMKRNRIVDKMITHSALVVHNETRDRSYTYNLVEHKKNAREEEKREKFIFILEEEKRIRTSSTPRNTSAEIHASKERDD